MVRQQPAGIPLKKLAVFYSQTYHKNLTLSSLGFDSMANLVASLHRDLVVEGELVFHKIHCRARLAGAAAGASTKATEEVLENIVAMVRQFSTGVPLKKLAVYYSQTYHKNLTLSSLGFDSMASLVASLDRNLVVEEELVFYKDHRRQSRTGAGAGAGALANAAEDNERSEEVLENVVALMKEHPDGIPLKKVAIVYSQKYRHNLSLASLGFKTITCLVASLKEDLVVRGEVAFHKNHQPVAGKLAKATDDSRPATPQHTESVIGKSSTATVTVPQVDVSSHYEPPTQAGINLLGHPLISTDSLFSAHCPPVNTLFTASKPAQKQTQQQLYQRVLEVSYVDRYIDHAVFFS